MISIYYVSFHEWRWSIDSLAPGKHGDHFKHNAMFNSLWPYDAIWRHSSGSTLVQLMACCLMAPSYYLNQCWLIINGGHWHLAGGNFTETILGKCIEAYSLDHSDDKSTVIWSALIQINGMLTKILMDILFTRGQWVNMIQLQTNGCYHGDFSGEWSAVTLKIHMLYMKTIDFSIIYKLHSYRKSIIYSSIIQDIK